MGWKDWSIWGVITTIVPVLFIIDNAFIPPRGSDLIPILEFGVLTFLLMMAPIVLILGFLSGSIFGKIISKIRSERWKTLTSLNKTATIISLIFLGLIILLGTLVLIFIIMIRHTDFT